MTILVALLLVLLLCGSPFYGNSTPLAAIVWVLLLVYLLTRVL